MRMDKYLKVSRLIKRRTLANEACDSGRVTINGRSCKPGSEVKPGDMVEIRFGGGITKFKVLSVATQISKDSASSMYELMT
jgi:ribosomal 50S subunit-recycling heat shock protein